MAVDDELGLADSFVADGATHATTSVHLFLLGDVDSPVLARQLLDALARQDFHRTPVVQATHRTTPRTPAVGRNRPTRTADLLSLSAKPMCIDNRDCDKILYIKTGYPVSSTDYHMLWSGPFPHDVSIGHRFAQHRLLH